jgi:hypothetical protein
MADKHYCRSCDEFFLTCGCETADINDNEHVAAHRVYLWTATGVVAIPDFDTFQLEPKPARQGTRITWDEKGHRLVDGKPGDEYAGLSEEQRIALGFRPRTLRGWAFWLRYWSPPALWWLRLKGR